MSSKLKKTIYFDEYASIDRDLKLSHQVFAMSTQGKNLLCHSPVFYLVLVYTNGMNQNRYLIHYVLKCNAVNSFAEVS